jgi:hypothetical protein
MSTPPAAEPVPVTPVVIQPREIRVYSHSALFYWWPVWAVGFIMAALTYYDGYVMALVPVKSTAELEREVAGHPGRVDVIVAPPNKHIALKPDGTPQEPRLHMARSKNLGVLFVVVLLIIIVISNVPLHGLWSVIVILGILLLGLVFALVRWADGTLWDYILDRLSYLDIRINLGGYLFISIVLFVIWALTVYVFDRRRYVEVTAGQVRVVQAIGTGADVYDTTGLTFSKRQDDLFRHWIVGLGSGDLIIHRPNQKDIQMPNVLFVGTKVKQMEDLIRSKEVV